jgi:hypothetical protein
MLQDFSWDEMVRMLRLLGGTAENIMPATEGGGRGLMAVSPETPVQVRVPPNLVFTVEDVEFADDRLRLKKTANAGEAERLFFDSYQTGFSWGAARSKAVLFINHCDTLPADVRALLGEEFGFEDLLEGDALERAQKWFLKSRAIHLGETDFLLPVIELANHGAGGLTLYSERGGLNIQGAVSDEVRVTYGAYDSFSLFRTFGLVGAEPGAFSQPMEVQFENRRFSLYEPVNQHEPERLSILQDTGSRVQDGKIWVPPLTFENGIGILPFLMIGHRRMPKQPRSIFRAAAAQAQIDKPDEIFDIILQFNWARFLNLLTLLEPHEGDAVVALRTVVRYQLEAISHCVGSMEIDAMPPAKEKEEAWRLSIS